MINLSKYFSLCVFIALIVTACGESADQNAVVDNTNNVASATGVNAESESVSVRFNALLDNYYEEELKLNPIQATFAGDDRYNNQFVNNLSPQMEQTGNRL